MLTAKDIGVCMGDKAILDKVGFALKPQQWLMVVGPNGAGKTTLVRAVGQSLPHTGRVLFEGDDLSEMRARHRAKLIGVLRQTNNVAFSYTVREVVQLGRYAYKRHVLERTDEQDAQFVEHALRQTGLYDKQDHSVRTLSGGELQRTFLAQLFAQDPRVLLLDEPASHLDLIYQKQMFDLIREWLQQPGRAVLSVVHDLSLARAYGTHALLMDKGRTVACGPLMNVFTRARLDQVYAMDVFGWMRDMLDQWSA